MVFTDTILCATSGVVNASTPVALIDSMTGLAAVLPTGAVVRKFHIYRDGDNAVTTGCTMQLGVVGNTSKYIGVSENFNTTDLNNGHLLFKNMSTDQGLSADTELRLTLNNTFSTGSLVFEIDYSTYS